MNKPQFFEGQQLEDMSWADGSEIKVGRNECVEILIVMECGQMAGVPWALATYKDGVICKHNLATVQSVCLKTTKSGGGKVGTPKD